MKWKELKNNINVVRVKKKTKLYTAYCYYRCNKNKHKRQKKVLITKKQYDRLIKIYS